MRLAIAAFVLLIAASSEGATIAASSCSRADVGTAVTASSNGDTVTIPAGTCVWTSGLTIAKAITLQGAGIGNTIIQDGIVARTTLIEWTLVANLNSRMTGIEFEDASGGADNTNGVIKITGANTDARRMRIDHVRFDDLHGFSVFAQDVLGVFDNNEYYQNHNCSCVFIYVYHENWDGVTNSDASWSDPPNLGSEEFLFLESSTFEYIFTPHRQYAITDAYRGARYIVRYNTIKNAWVELHGTDSGGRKRGARAVEIYNNVFTCTLGEFCNLVANYRSGTGVIQNNTTTNYTSPAIALSVYRVFYPFDPWGAGDGTNSWDINLGGGPFASGTATGGSTGTLVDSGASFSGLTGYVVRRTSCTGYCHSIITSHTGTQLNFVDGGGYPALITGTVAASPAPTTTTATVSGGGVTGFTVGENIKIPCSGGVVRRVTANTAGAITWTPAATAPSASDVICEADLTFVSGEGYQIYKPLELLDQPGRGQGTQLSGESPTPANDQVDEPIYECNNGDIAFSVSYPVQIRENEHWFADTCKPGYTPYAYPHPLVGSPPVRLRVRQ